MKENNLFSRIKQWANNIKRDTYALFLAYRSPEVSWIARIVAALVVAYAFSPIDLIPDFIPVLGYLDDLIIVPAGIALAVALIPPDVMQSCRIRAEMDLKNNAAPVNRVAGIVILLIWIVLLAWLLNKAIAWGISLPH